MIETHDENTARQRLGIPEEADRVLVMAESSHWDPNWLFTSDQYFRWMVRRNLDKAIDELDREPRRVYGLECTFFPEMYLASADETQRDRFRALVDAGRFRFTGSGVTTPDTFLPREETLLRDFLLGQEWLRREGMDQEPRLAYFPDSFGHSPGLPSLLRQAGFDMAAVTRIDGMFFPGTEWEPPSRYPRPGSTAERLLREERSLDFVWRDASGAEVLTHWNAFGYGHGDMIAAHGPVRWMTLPSFVPDRRESFVRKRIEKYIRDLSAAARTPYMLLTLGLDFVPPVRDLWELIDRWNERDYDRTGVWLTNAGLDDYLGLVGCHSDLLPAIDFDPNPYWTGFYTARPDLKRECLELADTLVLADGAAAAQDSATGRRVRSATADAWHVAVTSDHHDWITGTSPDRVAHKEQHPWLREARATAAAGLRSVVHATRAARASSEDVKWNRDGSSLEIVTAGLRAVVDAARGGCIVELHDTQSGRDLVRGPAADIVVFEDTGGLWRMGMEYAGGRFRQLDTASGHRADVRVEERGDTAVEIVVSCSVAGRHSERRYRFGPGPALRVRTRLGCDDRRTATLRFPTATSPESLRMHQPGGFVDRPMRRHFDPTFWPLHSVAAGVGKESTGIAIAADVPTALYVTPEGTIEVVAARNAIKEQAWGWVPLLANPARGRVRGDVEIELAIWPVSGTSAAATALYDAWLHHLADSDDDPDRSAARRLLKEAFTVDPGDVSVLAAKAAHRGPGTIVRLRSMRPGSEEVNLSTGRIPLRRAFLCDARERDIEELAVSATGSCRVPIQHGFASVRLLAE